MEQHLQRLEHQLNDLIADHARLAEENTRLRLTIEEQRRELIRTHEELAQLEKQYRSMETSAALMGVSEADRLLARRRVNRLIELVDKALNELTEQ